MLFHTKIGIDRRRWDVFHDLEDRDRLHKKTVTWFPEIPGGPCPNARQQHGILFRVENDAMILQSNRAPNIGSKGGYSIVAAKDVSANYAAIKQGRMYRFRIDANTSRRMPKDDGDWIPEAEQGVGLRTRVKCRRVGCGTREARDKWFEAAASRCGFSIEAHFMETLPAVRVGRGVLEATRFEGRLIVRDLDRFMGALTEGIGQGKAYGLGLVSLRNA